MRRGAAICSAFTFLVSVGASGCTDEAGGVATPTAVEPTSGGSGTGSGSTPQSGAGSGAGVNGSGTGSSSPIEGSSGVATASGLPMGSGVMSPSSGATSIPAPDASTPVTESGSSTGGGLPCAVQDLLANQCQSCHGVVPIEPAPNSLVTVADLTGASLVDSTKTNAQESVLRMENTVFPMPPAPGAPATVAEIAALQAWISARYPASMGCDGGVSEAPDASLTTGPSYGGPLVCSSGGTSSAGNGPSMRPGDPCSTCHNFAIAGTVYETEHETESCNGVNVSGANVVITGSDGTVTTIPVGAVGNFYSTASIVGPFQAKIVYQGRERDMLSPQAFGSCNFCHTPDGANSAPGRIMLP
jgi:mono/diheme cytochrome c family protein